MSSFTPQHLVQNPRSRNKNTQQRISHPKPTLIGQTLPNQTKEESGNSAAMNAEKRKWIVFIAAIIILIGIIGAIWVSNSSPSNNNKSLGTQERRDNCKEKANAPERVEGKCPFGFDKPKKPGANERIGHGLKMQHNNNLVVEQGFKNCPYYNAGVDNETRSHSSKRFINKRVRKLDAAQDSVLISSGALRKCRGSYSKFSSEQFRKIQQEKKMEKMEKTRNKRKTRVKRSRKSRRARLNRWMSVRLRHHK